MTIQPPHHETLDDPKILFRPRIAVPGVDSECFRTTCTTTIALALLLPQIPTRAEVIAKLKIWDTWTPEFTWPNEILVGEIVQPWSRASAHTGSRSEMRAIHVGRQMTNEFRLTSYQANPGDQTAMRIHCVLHLHGGGSKVDLNHQLRQSVVEFFLQAGADPLQVNDYAKVVCEKAGSSRIQHVMQVKDQEERLVQIQRLAKALNIRPVQTEDPEQDRTKKMRAWRPKALSQIAAVHASGFKLIDGHFALVDGTPASVVTWQTKDPVGVLLLDADTYHGYMNALSQTPHALGIAILGNEYPVSNSHCCKLHVAATDLQGVQVIIKTCFHQAGKIEVQPITKDGDNIQVAESKLVAVIAWKVEMASETWSDLLKSPAKVCAKALSITPSEHYGVAP